VGQPGHVRPRPPRPADARRRRAADDYAKDGQLWGFPLYNWERMRERDYSWWLARFRTTLARFDAVRIDHFIGFHRAWAVPARLKNALKGPLDHGLRRRRVRAAQARERLARADRRGPRRRHPEVEKLRDGFDLPGIRVLQFGFGWDPAQTHLPHKFPKRSLAATGTHDNDTTLGWYRAIDNVGMKDWVHRYLQTNGNEIHWVMMRAVLNSPADTAILPIQDLLGLGSEGRMNRPGVASGNWAWRMAPGALTPEILARLRKLTEESGRSPVTNRPSILLRRVECCREDQGDVDPAHRRQRRRRPVQPHVLQRHARRHGQREREGKAVKLTLYLSDGTTLDVCSIDELTDGYVAARAYQKGNDTCDVSVQLIPYGLIYRIEISPKVDNTDRVGFHFKTVSRRSATTAGRVNLSSSLRSGVGSTSSGIRRSPRGERLTDPTFGPGGRQVRLNCWV
jgi:hypothetical protein